MAGAVDAGPGRAERPALWKRILGPIIKLAVTVGLMAWILFAVDFKPETAWASWKDADYGWLGLAALAELFVIGVGVVRWHLLLGAIGVHVPLWKVGVFNMIGFFFQNFSIGIAGADAARTVYIWRLYPDKKAATLLSIFADRLMGLLGMCVVGLFVLPLSWELVTARQDTAIVVWLFAGMLVGGVAGTLLLLAMELPSPIQKFFGWKERLPFAKIRLQFGDAVRAYATRWRTCAVAMALSITVHFFIIVCAYCVAQGLNHQIPFSLMVGMIPVVGAVSASPTVGGFGPRELLIIAFYQTVGETGDAALIFSFTFVAVMWFVASLGGLLLIFYRMPRAEQEDLQEATA